MMHLTIHELDRIEICGHCDNHTARWDVWMHEPNENGGFLCTACLCQMIAIGEWLT